MSAAAFGSGTERCSQYHSIEPAPAQPRHLACKLTSVPLDGDGHKRLQGDVCYCKYGPPPSAAIIGVLAFMVGSAGLCAPSRAYFPFAGQGGRLGYRAARCSRRSNAESSRVRLSRRTAATIADPFHLLLQDRQRQGQERAGDGTLEAARQSASRSPLVCSRQQHHSRVGSSSVNLFCRQRGSRHARSGRAASRGDSPSLPLGPDRAVLPCVSALAAHPRCLIADPFLIPAASTSLTPRATSMSAPSEPPNRAPSLTATA